MIDGKKVVCIVQARMGSSRLPGKVLKKIKGHPMIYWVVTRASKAQCVDQTIVATTVDRSDDPIYKWCSDKDVVCCRGSEFDVLDRFYRCARAQNADIVVRVTGDCPLVDPNLIDDLLREFSAKKVDFAANRLPPPYLRTFPIGLDVEIASFGALEKAWKEAQAVFEREHVMPYLYNEPGRFKTFILDHPIDYGSERWTVDTPEDLEFIQAVFNELENTDSFSWLEILSILKAKPHLRAINAEVRHKHLREIDARAGDGEAA